MATLAAELRISENELVNFDQTLSFGSEINEADAEFIREAWAMATEQETDLATRWGNEKENHGYRD